MEKELKIDTDGRSSDTILFFGSSSSSSTSDDTSDSEENAITKTVRIENYLNVITNYTGLQFKQHFRLKRIVADKVISCFS